ELHGAAEGAVEIPEVVGAEDVSTRSPERLPALALKLRSRVHDFMAAADMEGHMIEPDRHVRHLHQKQMVVFRSSGRAQERSCAGETVGHDEPEPLDVEALGLLEIRYEIDD